MRLNDIQNRFKNVILEPDKLKDSAFQNLFRQEEPVCLENRMKVYRNNVIRSLTDAVTGSLPMTEKLTGKDFLEKAARVYVVNSLPTQGNLNLYGATFADFMASYEPVQSLAYLPDFIRLEWAWEEASYAPDDTPLPIEALTTIAPEHLPFLTLSPRTSFFLIDSPFPLDEIVDFCRAETQDNLCTLSPRGVKLMVFRPALQTQIRRLDEEEFSFLKNMAEGKTLQQTCSCASDTFNLTEILQKHLMLGTFSSFEIRT